MGRLGGLSVVGLLWLVVECCLVLKRTGRHLLRTWHDIVGLLREELLVLVCIDVLLVWLGRLLSLHRLRRMGLDGWRSSMECLGLSPSVVHPSRLKAGTGPV